MTRDGTHDRPVGRGEPSSSYTGEASGWNELAEKLSTLSRDLQGETEGTLHAIVQAATGTVPGAEYASISAVDKHNASAAAAPTSAGCSGVGRTAAPVLLVSGVVRCRARLLGAG